MSAKERCITSLIFLYRTAQHHSQFKAGPLPRDPNQIVLSEPVEFRHLFPGHWRKRPGQYPNRDAGGQYEGREESREEEYQSR